MTSSGASTTTFAPTTSTRGTPSSTSATRRTRSRRGASRSRSGTSPTTARSTRCGRTAKAMRGRRHALGGGRWAKRLAEIGPLVTEVGSDSQSLDDALELLVLSGMRIDQAIGSLIPAAEGLGGPALDPALARSEPWDGPAALVFSDGRRVGALLDRNGLRPLALTATRDGLVVVSSEAGSVDLPADRVTHRRRLGPGEMVLVDVADGRVIGPTVERHESPPRSIPRRLVARGGAGPRTDRRTGADRARAGRRGREAGHPADGDRGARGDLEHGRRHADRAAGAPAASGVGVPAAGVRPGHQSADRPGARARRHVAGHGGRSRRRISWRRRRTRPMRSSSTPRSSTTRAGRSCSAR